MQQLLAGLKQIVNFDAGNHGNPTLQHSFGLTEGPNERSNHMRNNLVLSAAAAALLAATGAAFAQSNVTATTDLNVRAGPGPHHPVVDVLGAGQSATLS